MDLLKKGNWNNPLDLGDNFKSDLLSKDPSKKELQPKHPEKSKPKVPYPQNNFNLPPASKMPTVGNQNIRPPLVSQSPKIGNTPMSNPLNKNVLPKKVPEPSFHNYQP